MFKSLSGRFLILTIIFVMVAEILIFVPSIARFREDYINVRLERAQLASLALEADSMITRELELELLATAEVFNVVLRRDEARQLMLSGPIPDPVSADYDLRNPSAWTLIVDAMKCLLDRDNSVMRVIGNPVREAGLLIEVTMPTAPLRAAMLDYGLRILALSAFISIITASLLFLAVRRLLVAPIRGVVDHMQTYAEAPEDARRIITPASRVTELREAEDALLAMQTDLTSALKQKDRLAQLGSAVAKISHDLRNILTSAQLFTDRIEASEDPTVRRLAPKLIRSISRAVNLCETTLAYGRAEEPAPTLEPFVLAPLVDDVLESEGLAASDRVDMVSRVGPTFAVHADREQVYRVLSNLVRNARQAIEAKFMDATITISATDTETLSIIEVSDTGPGLPQKAKDNLFTAFTGGTTQGGSGLGLAICAELIRGHGGALILEQSGDTGTVFRIELPKS